MKFFLIIFLFGLSGINKNFSTLIGLHRRETPFLSRYNEYSNKSTEDNSDINNNNDNDDDDEDDDDEDDDDDENNDDDDDDNDDDDDTEEYIAPFELSTEETSASFSTEVSSTLNDSMQTLLKYYPKQHIQPSDREDLKIKLMLGIALLALLLFLILLFISCFAFYQGQKECPKIYKQQNNVTTKPELADLSYFQPAEGISDTSFSNSPASSTVWKPEYREIKKETFRTKEATALSLLHDADARCMKLVFGNEVPSKELDLSSVEPHTMETSYDEMYSKEMSSEELGSCPKTQDS
ncbi:equatorin [Monodelphis domestica]|uniref:equatorin n=1 Tax=Monodelphis domestica TaxID=13616 RepID=UPI0024E260B8|nr:equatorin [Monodelphis domestica]